MEDHRRDSLDLYYRLDIKEIIMNQRNHYGLIHRFFHPCRVFVNMSDSFKYMKGDIREAINAANELSTNSKK